MKKLLLSTLCLMVSLSFTSCTDDELDTTQLSSKHFKVSVENPKTAETTRTEINYEDGCIVPWWSATDELMLVQNADIEIFTGYNARMTYVLHSDELAEAGRTATFHYTQKRMPAESLDLTLTIDRMLNGKDYWTYFVYNTYAELKFSDDKPEFTKEITSMNLQTAKIELNEDGTIAEGKKLISDVLVSPKMSVQYLNPETNEVKTPLKRIIAYLRVKINSKDIAEYNALTIGTNSEDFGQGTSYNLNGKFNYNLETGVLTPITTKNMNISDNVQPALISDEFLVPVIPGTIKSGEKLYVTVTNTTVGEIKREIVLDRDIVIEPGKLTRLTIQVNEDGIY